ncbi:hypothetical protein [Pseudonocardia sp. WMMC193]|uniref:hypothetical protein n=1 Tax=Pseudonocardia sp. WMMC193 TaxID=2911965 RepID=UPI001F2B5485|nr:hypothetical protein [Pseudonocardia sp. WMMC193]MCF7547488.1 hypothetical protein [Pseudonocardia sp. WMMC193]
MIAWPEIVARLKPGDRLRPLVGASQLTVDSIDDEQICIRQRLWRACLTPADIETANRILADAPAGVSGVRFSELLRAHYTSGSDVTTECTRIPNLAAVVFLNLGAVSRAAAPRESGPGA